MKGLSILLVTSLALTLQMTHARSHYQGMVVESWGEEFCRPSLCSLMPTSRWDPCCRDHGYCCAYAELLKPKGPFSYEEGGASRSSEESKESIQEAPDTFRHAPDSPQSSPDDADQLASEETSLESQPRPQAQPQRQPRPHQPQSFSQVRPQQDPAYTQPIRTYNEVMEAKDRKRCRPRYCSLLAPNKQSLCCNKYKKCCEYADLYRNSDPFSFEKEAYRH